MMVVVRLETLCRCSREFEADLGAVGRTVSVPLDAHGDERNFDVVDVEVPPTGTRLLPMYVYRERAVRGRR